MNIGKEIHLSKKETMDLFHYIEHVAVESDRILALDTLVSCLMKYNASLHSIKISDVHKGFSVISKYYNQFYKVE